MHARGRTARFPAAPASAAPASPAPALAVPAAPETPFGALLKTWRQARRLSQLDLAGEADVSQRHLSCLERGRAGPSREMVMRLAQVLALPLRERNALFVAAGFAPPYPQRPLDDAALAAVHAALETTLDHHEPYPALVLDRHWNLVLHNAAVDRLIALVGPPARVWAQVDPSGRRNLLRLALHPQGLQPLVVDWPLTAGVMLGRLRAELRANPADAGLRALLSELLAFPGVPADAADTGPAVLPVPPPVLALQLRRGEVVLSLFAMVCSFGTALDLTAAELRLELLFPSDAATARLLREAAGQV